MKSLITFIFLLTNLAFFKAQDSLPRYELGTTILTINSTNTKYLFANTRPAYEFINGLFFRCVKKHFGYRALISYNESTFDYGNSAIIADGVSGHVNNKNFMIGGGMQINLKKKKEWLYAFADLCYRNQFSMGKEAGGFAGFNRKYSNSANGLDSYLGLGLKIKIIKHVFLSPEFTYNIYFCKTHTNSADLNSGTNARSSSTNLNINSIFKLHLTAKF